MFKKIVFLAILGLSFVQNKPSEEVLTNKKILISQENLEQGYKYFPNYDEFAHSTKTNEETFWYFMMVVQECIEEVGIDFQRKIWLYSHDDSSSPIEAIGNSENSSNQTDVYGISVSTEMFHYIKNGYKINYRNDLFPINEQELKWMILHEISHLKNHDIEYKRMGCSVYDPIEIPDETEQLSDRANANKASFVAWYLQTAYMCFLERRIEKRCDLELVKDSRYAEAGAQLFQRVHDLDHKKNFFLNTLLSTHPTHFQRMEYMRDHAEWLKSQGK